MKHIKKIFETDSINEDFSEVIKKDQDNSEITCCYGNDLIKLSQRIGSRTSTVFLTKKQTKALVEIYQLYF